jgi:hypothetical protein
MRPRIEEEEEEREEREYRHRRPDRDRGRGYRGGTRRDHVVVSTAIIGVILFLILGMPYIKRHLANEAAILNSIGGGDLGPESDREAVRQWLRDNGDDPHPREIRWWPSHEVSKLDRERREASREDVPVEHRSGDRVCRLQYREQAADGNEISRDDLFLVSHGKVRLLAKDSSMALAARRSFADDDGVP